MSVHSLFLVFVKIAALTFGGGYAMVPFFESELVNRYQLLSSEEFANLVGLAQITPGPVGFNSATYVGMNEAHWMGAIAASVGVMVPSLIITVAIAVFLKKSDKAQWLKLLMKGIRPCVIGIIAAAVVFFAKTALCWQGGVVFAAVILFRLLLPKFNPILSIFLSAILGYVLFL